MPALHWPVAKVMVKWPEYRLAETDYLKKTYIQSIYFK